MSEATRYTIALEEQLKLAREIGNQLHWGDGSVATLHGVPGGKSTIGVNGNTTAKSPSEFDLGYFRIIQGLLELATPFYVSRPIARLLEDAAHTLPGNTTLIPSDLPAKCGFVWIDEPKGWPLSALTAGGYQHSVKAFLWAWDDPLYRVSAINSLNIIPFGYSYQPGKTPHYGKIVIDDFDYLSTLGDVVWDNGDTVDRNQTEDERLYNFLQDHEGKVYQYKYIDADMTYKDVEVDPYEHAAALEQIAKEMRGMFASLMHFAGQRISKTSPSRVPREVRRRLPEEFIKRTPEPVVQVIELRATDYIKDAPSSSGEGHYSTRWIVRGHWRKQWYASEQRHKPKWIESYVKGPEGLPVKGGAKLFAVVK